MVLVDWEIIAQHNLFVLEQQHLFKAFERVECGSNWQAVSWCCLAAILLFTPVGCLSKLGLSIQQQRRRGPLRRNTDLEEAPQFVPLSFWIILFLVFIFSVVIVKFFLKDTVLSTMKLCILECDFGQVWFPQILYLIPLLRVCYTGESK